MEPLSHDPSPNTMPTAQDVVAALDWAGFTEPRARRLSSDGRSAIYQVTLHDCAEVDDFVFEPWICSGFCEAVEIKSLIRQGNDVHLGLKLTMPPEDTLFPGCLP